MKNQTQNKPGGTSLAWRGVTALTASVLAVSVTAVPIVNSFRTDIDKFLGTKSTRIVTDTTADTTSAYTFVSDYSSTTELLQGMADVGERLNEEGSVLLKNNGALPLTADETKKVSLLGFSSYYPVQGGDMGSSLSVNTGTDADTVDLVAAFTEKGFGINTTLQTMYTTLAPTFKTEVESWGGTTEYTHITSPSLDSVFSSKEPSQTLMDSTEPGWKDTLKDHNVMIVTIARSAGENRGYLPGTDGVDSTQNLNQTDPLGLSDDERDLITAAVTAKAANNGKVIVLLNNASTMEVQEIEDNEGVDAILQIGLPGAYGFYGVADILSGAVNPSGHLSDTYAVTNANSPAAQNYGDYEYTNADTEHMVNSEIVEAEGIYIGYKYYETRYADTVLGQGNAAEAVGSSTGSAWNYDEEVTYPFGYGLSYTTFTQTLDDLQVDLGAETVTATVTVTNTGKVAGKDVVQLYVSTPYTAYDQEHGVEKSAVQLLDYEKTGELAPGASETVSITADAQYMASWDSTASNAAGTTGCYILDDGTYYFSVGNGSHEAVCNVLAAQEQTVEGDAAKAKSWVLDEFDGTTFATTKNGTAVENQLADADLNTYMPGTVTYLSRSDWSGTWPKTYENLSANEAMMEALDNNLYDITANGDPASITFGAANGLTLADLKGVTDLEDERWTSLMDQITLQEAMIRTGFGGTSCKTIDSITSPEVIQNDGPNGFNSYTLGQYANTDTTSDDPCAVDANDPNLSYKAGVMPNETVIAQTFSKEMANAYGKVMGNYSLWSNCTILWGVGNNLHRVPYNARNHEYYSEDSILSAYQGVASIEGATEYGCILAPKHYAFNDTEINRTGISVFMTEQKAREGELRCTQACIEDANALGLMTAFNRIGTTAVNAHAGVMKNILRDEWGFKGLISEDFIQNAEYVHLKEAVLNGVTMSCNTGDNTMAAVTEKYSYWTEAAVSTDATMMAALKQAMTWQNYALANSNAMDGLSSSSRLESVRTWYDNLITGLQIAFGVLTVLSAAMYIRSATRRKKD